MPYPGIDGGPIKLVSLVDAAGTPIYTDVVSVSGTAAVTQSGTWTVQPGNTANTTAWKVDGSAVTQPVSGTVSITANSAVNVAQVNGITPLMGNGITGTGSQRVTIASDNTAFSVNGTLVAETTKVIGTVRNVGNVGAVLDGVNTAATAPANGILGLGIFNTTEPSPTTGQSVGVQLDSKGRQRQVIMDAAGNTRGANVDANNNLGIVLPAETTKVIGTINIAASQNVAVPSVATGGASFLNIVAGQATTTVKSGAGTLYAIVLNSAATATNTTTMYDNTAASGTVIGRPAVTTATVPTTLTFGPSGMAFATGLTIITAVANGGDMTIVYK